MITSQWRLMISSQWIWIKDVTWHLFFENSSKIMLPILVLDWNWTSVVNRFYQACNVPLFEYGNATMIEDNHECQSQKQCKTPCQKRRSWWEPAWGSSSHSLHVLFSWILHGFPMTGRIEWEYLTAKSWRLPVTFRTEIVNPNIRSLSSPDRSYSNPMMCHFSPNSNVLIFKTQIPSKRRFHASTDFGGLHTLCRNTCVETKVKCDE